MSKKVKPKAPVRKSKKTREVIAVPGAPEAELVAASLTEPNTSPEVAVDSVFDSDEVSPLPPRDEKWVPPLGPPEVPSVWRDAGYLALVLAFHNGQVYFISSSAGGESMRLSLPMFWQHVRPTIRPVDPIRCALSFLARERSGLFSMRVRDTRRITEMVTKDALEKMSERDLAAEYRKLVDPKGPQRVKSDKKADFIEKILAAAKEMGAKVEAVGEGGATKPPKAPKVPKEKKVKEPKPAKPPREPKAAKSPKEPKEPKAARVKKDPKAIKASGGNPYREGTMKNLAFAAYVATKGDRAKTVEAATKAGATASTASSWYAAFNKL